MKAAVLREVRQSWRIEEIDRPALGPDQVLIRVRASGLCFTDVHATEGHLPLRYPAILGHEPVGEIIEIGSAVHTRRIGDRVGVVGLQRTCGRCEWCERGQNTFCTAPVAMTGFNVGGGNAEYLAAYAEGTILLPDALTYEQAAPIMCAGYTVWSGLCWARPEPAQTVAVLGIGGLGHLAVQYAKAAGFRTVAISHSPDKADRVRALGADDVVSDGAALAKLGGADVLLATGNSTQALEDCLGAVRPDGRVIAVGIGEKPLSVSGMDLLMRRIQIVGSQHNGRRYLYEALQMAAAGKVKVVTECYPLHEAPKAYERVRAGQVRFRAVLVND